MHSLPRASFVALLTLAACGPTGPIYVPYERPPVTGADTGSSCSSDSDCEVSCVEEFPGGYCSAKCTDHSECGSKGACLDVGKTAVCVSTCPSPGGGRSTCRQGYICNSFNGRNHGFCFPEEEDAPPPPPAKSPTGASCSSNSQCGTDYCGTDWPGGYCTRSCTYTEQCGVGGICLHDVANDQTYCVSKCPSPGSQSTCRQGYSCYPFAAPRTDGYCEVAGQGTGGGAGGGGGSGGGGTGGGTAAPTTINYKIIGVQGSYSGNATHVESATRTDTLAMNTCTYSSPGTTASQSAFIGQSGFTPFLSVYGPTACPPGMATSTAAASCTSQAINVNGTLEWKVEMSGWTDASVVTFKVRYPPVMMPACNHATVIMNGTNEWGIQGTTTVGKFRAGVAFPVRFVGARMLNVSSPYVKASEVSWDFTMTIQPL